MPELIGKPDDDVYAMANLLTNQSGWSFVGNLDKVDINIYDETVQTVQWGIGKPMQKYATAWDAGWPVAEVVPEHLCPNCRRDRHSEPLRQRVAQMLSSHTFDVDYDAGADISPVVCVGSYAYGPNREFTPSACPPSTLLQSIGWIQQLLTWPVPTMEPVSFNLWTGLTKEDLYETVLGIEPPPLDVKLDPVPLEKPYVPPAAQKAGRRFLKLLRPKKKSPDVSALVEQFNKAFPTSNGVKK